MRLEGIFAAHARRQPQAEALVCGPVRVTYGELHRQVRHAACALHALGVGPGDRVLLHLPNGIEFVQLAYAAFSVGATVVPANTRLAPPEVAHIVADSQPVLAACHESGRAALAALPVSARRVVVGAPQAGEIAIGELLDAPLSDLPDVPVEFDDCLILYTSGTTGRAKGAVNTHANMVTQGIHIHGREWGVRAGDRVLVTTPIAHRAGVARMINSLGFGGTLVIMDRFDPLAALALIRSERITTAGLVPTVIRMMLPHIREDPGAFASLRTVIVSTEAFPVTLKQEVMALLPNAQFHALFGSSECLVTNLGHAEQFTHAASVGRPIPGVEVRLADAQGRDVPRGEAGELLVRDGRPGSGATMRCYFNLPAETAAALKDGWFHTGDMAREDEGGYLYIVDRKKDMVLTGGYNVYSKEVEEVLRTHPAVADVAVIGVPDAVYGEAVAAFIEARAGADAAGLDAGAMAEHCRERMAGYKKPKHVWVLPALPRNSTGKVLKNELRKQAISLI
jgi:long-chain acyl-CoA synthetase